MIRQLIMASLGLALLMQTACDMGSSGRSSSTDGHGSMEGGKAAFATYDREGRIWVFKKDSEAHAQFVDVGEPAKNVTLIGVGPNGETIKSDSKETIIEWMAAKPGYLTKVHDERLWILEIDSEAYDQFMSTGEPAKSVTLIGEGPTGISVRSDSKETYLVYLAAKPGYVAAVEDERLWVLKEGSEAHQQFEAVGEPAKSYTMIGAGPMGISLRSDSKETICEWAVSAPGFNTYLREERIWVFIPGSEAEAEFIKVGEPAKNATKINAGPMGMTVKSVDFDTINAYLAAVGS